MLVLIASIEAIYIYIYIYILLSNHTKVLKTITNGHIKTAKCEASRYNLLGKREKLFATHSTNIYIYIKTTDTKPNWNLRQVIGKIIIIIIMIDSTWVAVMKYIYCSVIIGQVTNRFLTLTISRSEVKGLFAQCGGFIHSITIY